MLELRAALSGPWASAPRALLILLPPGILLVLFQESTHDHLSWQLVVVSALVQHLVMTFFIVVVATIARAIWGSVPIGVNIFSWILVGTARGLASGFVFLLFGVQSSQFTPEHADANFLVRCTYWISVCLVWLPLFIYVAAQLDRRRTLLKEAEQATTLRDAARIRAERTSGELSAQLVSAVRDAIAPVIADISRSLEALGSALSPAAFTAIGERIARVSQDATNIISGETSAQNRKVVEGKNVHPLRAAMDFERNRPVFAGVLTGLALAAMVVPNALTVGRAPAVVEALVALPMTTIVLIGLVNAQSRMRLRRTNRQLPLLLATYLLAGFAGSVILLIINAGHFDLYDVTLIALLPIGVAVCAITISSAVGLASANRQLVEHTALLNEEIAHFEEKARTKEQEVRSRLSILMHGPVQGRLSACVMALTFHAQEGDEVDPERTAFITNAVLEHLETASRDLDALVATDSAPATHLDSQA